MLTQPDQSDIARRLASMALARTRSSEPVGGGIASTVVTASPETTAA